MPPKKLKNKLVYSKTQLLSNIFHIPKNIEKQLHILIFQYIWYYEKIEPISRSKLYLSKEKSGIGILRPNRHNKVWTALAKYHILSKIYNLYKDFHYLKQNSIAKK